MKIPKKLDLANIPTPVQKLKFNNAEFLIKRDDYTGVELSGNKIRKLEYLLYDAKKKKADYVFTRGGEQSNHARATAIAAAQVGIKSKLFLWGQDRKTAEGNLFLDKMVGAEIDFLNKENYRFADDKMKEEKENFSKRGLNAVVIAEGGSSSLGIWGYINFVDELKAQISTNKIKSILHAAGSGGTSAGLLVGAALYKIPVKILAVNVLYDPNEFKEKIIELAERAVADFKIDVKINPNNLEMIDGYSEEGYKHISDDKVDLFRAFAKQTGILLDPTYTGKAFFAFNDLFLKGKKTTKTLFLHTGGIYGAFAKRSKYLNAEKNK